MQQCIGRLDSIVYQTVHQGVNIYCDTCHSRLTQV